MSSKSRVVVGVDQGDVLGLDHAGEHLAQPGLQGDACLAAERPDRRAVWLALFGARDAGEGNDNELGGDRRAALRADGGPAALGVDGRARPGDDGGDPHPDLRVHHDHCVTHTGYAAQGVLQQRRTDHDAVGPGDVDGAAEDV